MNGYDLDSIARRVIERAARRASTTLSARLQEEWMADLSERRGEGARGRAARPLTKLGFVNNGEFAY